MPLVNIKLAERAFTPNQTDDMAARHADVIGAFEGCVSA
jgi:phenylpyruvate tautomerase PptA (4-oxalocrotonate tautomerase family)